MKRKQITLSELLELNGELEQDTQNMNENSDNVSCGYNDSKRTPITCYRLHMSGVLRDLSRSKKRRRRESRLAEFRRW